MSGLGPSFTQAPDELLAGEAPVSVQTVLSALNGVVQTPAPSQVPASAHSVAGQVTPVQDAGEGEGEGESESKGEGLGAAQHAAQPAAAQPSVHSSAQVPSPQQSSGAGEARAGGARAPSARSASAIAAQGRSIARARVGPLCLGVEESLGVEAPRAPDSLEAPRFKIGERGE
jgi:hypothetical protein